MRYDFLFVDFFFREGVVLDDDNKVHVFPEQNHYRGYQSFFIERKLCVPTWDDEKTRPEIKTACKFLDKVPYSILNFLCLHVLLFEKRSGMKVMFNTFNAGQKIGNLLEIHNTSAGFISLRALPNKRPLNPHQAQAFCNRFLFWNELDQTKGKWVACLAMHSIVLCHITLAFFAFNSFLKQNYLQYGWIDKVMSHESCYWNRSVPIWRVTSSVKLHNEVYFLLLFVVIIFFFLG